MHGRPDYERRPLRWGDKEIYGLSPIQLHTGGLFDGEPHGATPIHLVRHCATGGTPGTLLCGIDQHTLPIGFSVGGGSYSPALGDDDPATAPCSVCVQVATRMALGVEALRISNGVGGARAARAVNAELERLGASDIAHAITYDPWRVAAQRREPEAVA